MDISKRRFHVSGLDSTPELANKEQETDLALADPFTEPEL